MDAPGITPCLKKILFRKLCLRDQMIAAFQEIENRLAFVGCDRMHDWPPEERFVEGPWCYISIHMAYLSKSFKKIDNRSEKRVKSGVKSQYPIFPGKPELIVTIYTYYSGRLKISGENLDFSGNGFDTRLKAAGCPVGNQSILEH